MVRLLRFMLLLIPVLLVLPVQAASIDESSHDISKASQCDAGTNLGQIFPRVRAGALERDEREWGRALAPSTRKGEAQLAQAHRAEQAGGWGLTLPEWFQNPPTLYFHTDHLGSTQFASNDEQVLTQHEEYFPSGEPWRSETDSKYELARRYVFAGKELDIHTGLFDYGARQYDARMGVWLSPDPILTTYMRGGPQVGVYDPANLGLYTLAWNNPVNVEDPDGRCPECTYSALRGTPAEKNLAKGIWNAAIRKVAGVLSFAASRPAWAPPPTRQELDATAESAVNFEQAATFDDVPVEAAVAGEVVVEVALAVAGAVAGTAAEAGKVIVRSGKWDYFFGRVDSSPHNKARSLQNLRDLKALGFDEAEGGREALTSLFERSKSLPEVSRHVTEHGTTITRNAKVGDLGSIDIKYYYPRGNMNATPEVSSIVPKVAK